MAATAPALCSVEREQPYAARERNRTGLLIASTLTILTVIIHGYHPYAEDGGLYLAGIKRLLHPDLFPQWSGFATAHLRFSLFAPLVASMVRVSHFSLMTVMLLLYAGSIWATLYSAWQIAARCYERIEACYGAVCFLALLLTVPVAGTSLMLMDPYVSARSISTPCGLFALVAVMDLAHQISCRQGVAVRSVILCFGSLFLAALVHPLMAGYALGFVLLLATASMIDGKLRWAIYGAAGLITIVACDLLIRFGPLPPAGYVEVAQTRTYWFLSYWHWYELAGLVLPLVMLALIRFQRKKTLDHTVKTLAEVGLVVGAISIFTASLFAHIGMTSYAVARLQPLRAFQTIYVITIMMVGAGLGQFALKRSGVRWAVLIGSLGGFMLLVQVDLFSGSNHLELPWVAPANGWEQAFLWIKRNTPTSAVVAVDADYITSRGEDAQNLRAIAERSAIPDYSKDGGIASIVPDLTSEWMVGETAQKGLDRATDVQRWNALHATGADWIILSSTAITSFQCEYANLSAKACRVPNEPRAHEIAPLEYPSAALAKLNVAHLTKPSISRH